MCDGRVRKQLLKMYVSLQLQKSCSPPLLLPNKVSSDMGMVVGDAGWDLFRWELEGNCPTYDDVVNCQDAECAGRATPNRSRLGRAWPMRGSVALTAESSPWRTRSLLLRMFGRHDG